MNWKIKNLRPPFFLTQDLHLNVFNYNYNVVLKLKHLIPFLDKETCILSGTRHRRNEHV